MAYNYGVDPAYMMVIVLVARARMSSSIFTPLFLSVSKRLESIYDITVSCVSGVYVESDMFTGCSGVDMVHVRRHQDELNLNSRILCERRKRARKRLRKNSNGIAKEENCQRRDTVGDQR